MGTSVSQSSPKNSTNWKRVFVCYETKAIPEKRLINEVWRAADHFKDQIPISNEIKSESIYKCFESVKSSKSFQEALKTYNDYLITNGRNSIVAEFAKRIIPLSFQYENPAQNWKNLFFSEITNYVVSRDASGFISKDNRNRTVTDMIAFKKNISNHVKSSLEINRVLPKSYSEWKNFVENTIDNLKNLK